MSTRAPLPDRTSAAHAADPAPTAVAVHPRSRIWLWIVALVLLQFVAWTAWLVIASKHRIAEVPLSSSAVGDKP